MIETHKTPTSEFYQPPDFDWTSSPGETIVDLLEERGWTSDVLAKAMECPPEQVEALLRGEAPITNEIAQKLQDILGSTAQFWISREEGYRADLKRLLSVKRGAIHTAYQVARFLLAHARRSGEGISPMKLQKLLYYAQGFSLARFNAPLFSEPIQAWQHGPVVPSVYHEFKSFGSNPIDISDDYNPAVYDEQVVELLTSVYDNYRDTSAWELRERTHNEPPWQEVQGRGGGEFSLEVMSKYFKRLL